VQALAVVQVIDWLNLPTYDMGGSMNSYALGNWRADFLKSLGITIRLFD
jgi:hypothetical protein